MNVASDAACESHAYRRHADDPLWQRPIFGIGHEATSLRRRVERPGPQLCGQGPGTWPLWDLRYLDLKFANLPRYKEKAGQVVVACRGREARVETTENRRERP